MSRISIEEMKAELDIEFFLDRESQPYRVTRGVSGVQLNIKECPDCHDNRWRTYFGADTGQGNCFVCNAKFDKLRFVHVYLGHGKTEWRQTFQFVEDLLREQGWRPRRKAVVAVDEAKVTLPLSSPLPTEAGETLAYLDQRGFGPDICAYFKLRFCEFGWWKFTDPEGNAQTQSFANRVIVPVYDLDGTLMTFQGRDITDTAQSKYLFPKELPGTGRYLLNGHNVTATDEIVIGEGVFDVAATKQAFDGEPTLRHIVPIGTFGKHLSYGSPTGDDQLGRFITLKARGIKTATFMWDGGEKELEAALNAAKLLTGIGYRARIALLPFGKDPNEVAAEVVRGAYFKAEIWTPTLDFKWRLKNPYSPRERVRLGLSQP